jgi:integrase
MTDEEEYRAIQQTVQTTNKNMARICSELTIPRVTTYTARHSFATVLKRSGASIEFISESLGHKSKQTTTNYLANFEDKEKRKWARLLLPEPDDQDHE